MGKGEIARYEQFLLFPQCFQKACFPGASKCVIVWEWVNHLKSACVTSEFIGDKNTRHNSADFVPTSNLVCVKEVVIRTTFCIPQTVRNRLKQNVQPIRAYRPYFGQILTRRQGGIGVT